MVYIVLKMLHEQDIDVSSYRKDSEKPRFLD